MFRGKESSNRIKISSRLIEFWCFGLPAALGEGAYGWGASEGMGVSPHMCIHMCMHAHALMHMHTG